MNIYVIDIGPSSYSAYAIPILDDYFKRNGHNLVRVTERLSGKTIHPSWEKLFLPLGFKEDFFVTWDLDLLPVSKDSLFPGFDFNYLNICLDSSIVYGQQREQNTFFFNCGLMGIPKVHQERLLLMANQTAPGDLPSYEQYHVNRWIIDNNIPINLLPIKFNTLLPRLGQSYDYWFNASCQHYTYGVNCNDKASLIKVHYEQYNV